MTLEPKCSNCKHRAPRNICAQELSPHYNQPVRATDYCEYFLANPAEGHFVNGIIGIAEGRPKAAITELDKAIALGLPLDSEMQAHYFLGSAYNSIVSSSELPAEQKVEMPEFVRALSEHEKGILIDRNSEFGYFSEPSNRTRLGSFDLECALAGSVLADVKGPGPAIAFLEEKLNLCDYLYSSPMIQVLLQLGILYDEASEEERAVSCFERIVQAEPVDRVDEQGLEAEAREMARGNLNILAQRKSAPSSTGGTKGSGCMLILVLIGSALIAVATNLIVP